MDNWMYLKRILLPFFIGPLLAGPLLLILFGAPQWISKWSNLFFQSLEEAYRKIGRCVPEKALRVGTLLLALGFSAIFIGKIHGFIDKVPVVTDDDTMPNVAVNLWSQGRYGFPASPTLIHFGTGGDEILKRQHFDGTSRYYNYGPVFFLVSGFLNRLFGDDTIAFFRMMNPWGIVFVIAAAFFLFGRISLMPPAFVAVGLVARFLFSASPIMARPDIAVSVCAALFFISSYRAVERGGVKNWFLVGFLAATAATSHLIAISILGVAAAVWFFYAVINWNESREIKDSVIGTFFGLAAGMFVFLVAIGFRLRELLYFVTLYSESHRNTPFSNFSSHYRNAWSASGWSYFLAWSGCIAGILLLASSIWMPREERKRALALLAAPGFAAFLYPLSIGWYNHHHPAYGIFANVTTFWVMGAFLAFSIWVVLNKFGRFRAAISWSLHLTTFLVLLASTAWAARMEPSLALQQHGRVPYSVYAQKITGAIPRGSYVWGTLSLGMRSGVDYDWIDSNSALALGLHVKPEYWNRILPDYLVFSYFTLEQYLRAGPLSGNDSPIAIFNTLTPGNIAFHLDRIVYAPPYGNTFIFKKGAARAPGKPSKISIAANDGSIDQWNVNVDVWTRPNAELVAPAKITTDRGTATASSSLRLNLERGMYLLKVGVPNPNVAQTGAVTATPDADFKPTGDTRIDHAPLFRGQTQAKFVVLHKGGNLFVSYFPGRSGKSVAGKSLQILGLAKILPGTEISATAPARPYISLEKIQQLLSCATKSVWIDGSREICKAVSDRDLRFIDQELKKID